MTIDEEIDALLAQAEPLRGLSPEDAEEAGLPAIIDRINELRAQQSPIHPLQVPRHPDVDPEAPKVQRGPGRRKVDA